MAVVNPSRTAGSAEGVNALIVAAERAAACTPAEKRGLLLLGLFKFSKALFFTAIGFGALHLVHRNLGQLVMQLVEALPIDPEGRVVSMVMDKADLIDGHDLRRIGAGAFIYATLCLIEGYGLVLRKSWGEYFTVILTMLGLPLELFELVHRATWFKAGALAANLAILWYLLWILKRRQRLELAQRLSL